jgi:ABC-2 type transport system permease protein
MLMLIKNELIKLFKRRSMIIMLAVIILASFLIMPLYSGGRYDYPDIYYQHDESFWWEDEAEWLESEYGKKDDKGNYIDLTDYGYEQRSRAAQYRYMLSIGMKSSSDWRYPLVEEMFVYKLTLDKKGMLGAEENERLLLLTDFVEKDDWRAFYTAEKEALQAAATSLGSSAHRIEAITFEYTYRLENDVKPGESNWRDQLLAKAATAKKSLAYYLEAEDAGEKVDPADTEEYRNTIALSLYRIDNNIEHDVSEDMAGDNYGAKTFWEFFPNSTVLITLVGIMLIVIAGRIVAEEYSGGTIKFLLICPAKRQKILFAKYFTLLIVGLMMMTALYVSSGIFALIYSGGEGIGATVLSVKNGVVRQSSPFIKLIVNYALQGVGMTVMATMAFAISSLMKSTALSVGIGLFAFTSGMTGMLLLEGMDVDFARYLIFANVDLAAIARGESLFEYQTLPVALLVIAVHMVVFLWTASDAFSRRDI